MSPRTPLPEVAALFLRLGATAFGGPAAHIAMMEDEVVRRKGWLTREQFLDYLGATNLIPGPNSTELAIHIGHARAGWTGLVVAGVSFLLPSSLMVTAIASLYVRYGALPDAARLLYAIKPVVIAIVLVALWNLARVAVKTAGLAALGIAAVIAVAAGVHELVVLAVAGLLAAIASRGARLRETGRSLPSIAAAALATPAVTAIATQSGAAAVPFGLSQLFLVFAKAGALLFGSGYVLLAFLRADLVERLGWLSEAQLVDAIAVGQVTPGPVFTTATFIGYLLGGPAGALVATIGIFLPAFVFVAISGPLVPRLRRSSVAAAGLDGVNIASLALMGVVTWHLGRATIADWPTLTIGLGALIALLRYQLNAAWLIVAGALAGAALARL